MSLNPFPADAEIAHRIAELGALVGGDIATEIAGLAAAKAGRVDESLGSMILRDEAKALIASYGLAGVEDLMLLALPAARQMAQPPVSGFFVGAVGLERETGHLILGSNLEFPRAHLGFTVHGEGFVFTRAAARGTTIETIAISEAHPCAHCRQYLSEFAGVRDLTLIDPLGHRLTMAELYPWPFDPGYLGETGFVPGSTNETLELGPNPLPAAIASRLLATGRAAHAPYSKCPAGVVLALADGKMVAGFAIESVAFNPTMGPLQAALIELVAHGYGPADIAQAALVTKIGGAVDYSHSTTELLGRIAPSAPLTITGWA